MFKRQDWPATEAQVAFGPERYDPSWNLPVATRGDGLYWLLDPEVHRNDIGVIEDHENWIFEHLLIPTGGVMIDIGGHVGCMAVWQALRGNTVYAFEPHPKHRELLLKNARLNAVSDKIKVSEYALGSNLELVYLKDKGSASDFETGGDIPVLMESLDNLFWNKPQAFPENRIDLVKIDIEGWEWEAVKGMPKLILDHKPKFVIEVHSHYHQFAGNGTYLHDYFKNLGYQYRIIWKNSDAYHYIEAKHPDQYRK